MDDIKKLTGRHFEGWRLEGVLGAGDSAIVYAARQNGKEAAIKIFFPEALGKHGFEEETARLELQMTLKGLKQHPNLVEIFGGGVTEEFGKTLFLIMEKVAGQTLDKVLDQVPRKSIGPLVRQLADAASFLEKKSLVHRDIKPANIVVNSDFSQLTLLDLGIVKSMANDDEGRLSGKRFVATPRYSPPEFVWRTEVDSIESWQAVTFYQVGGILHDLIMKKRLFADQDEPPARLYDSIRLVSPEIEAQDCEQWLILLARSCLIKDWRERARLVSWESFLEPNFEVGGIAQKQVAIRLRQIRKDELEIAQLAEQLKVPQDAGVQELWNLQDKVFLEVRRFLSGTQIFPRFSTNHIIHSPDQYSTTFTFERSPQLAFERAIKAEIGLCRKEGDGQSLELTVQVSYLEPKEELIDQGTWVEYFTVEKAASIIQQILIQVADRIVPQA